jgi:hypothetical protein
MTKMIALVVVVSLVIGSALVGLVAAVNVFGIITVHKQTQGEQTGSVQISFRAMFPNGTVAVYNSTTAGDTDKIDPQKGDVIVAAINAIINGEDINLEDLLGTTTEEEKEESSDDGGGGGGDDPQDPGPQDDPQEVNLTNPGINPGILPGFCDVDQDGDADRQCPTGEHDTCQGHPTCEVPPSPPEEGAPAPEPPKDPNPEPDEQVYGLVNCNGTFYYRSDCSTGPNNAT